MDVFSHLYGAHMRIAAYILVSTLITVTVVWHLQVCCKQSSMQRNCKGWSGMCMDSSTGALHAGCRAAGPEDGGGFGEAREEEEGAKGAAVMQENVCMKLYFCKASIHKVLGVLFYIVKCIT